MWEHWLLIALSQIGFKFRKAVQFEVCAGLWAHYIGNRLYKQKGKEGLHSSASCFGETIRSPHYFRYDRFLDTRIVSTLF